jgi:hypothetical protein
MRVDGIQRHVRLFRLMWERGGVGDGHGHSTKLAVGLRPRLFELVRDTRTDILVTLLGLRVHYCRSYGGIFG